MILKGLSPGEKLKRYKNHSPKLDKVAKLGIKRNFQKKKLPINNVTLLELQM